MVNILKMSKLGWVHSLDLLNFHENSSYGRETRVLIILEYILPKKEMSNFLFIIWSWEQTKKMGGT